MEKKRKTILKFLEQKSKELSKLLNLKVYLKFENFRFRIYYSLNDYDYSDLYFSENDVFPGCCGIYILNSAGSDEELLDELQENLNNKISIKQEVLIFLRETYLEVLCLQYGIHNTLTLNKSNIEKSETSINLFTLSETTQLTFVKAVESCIEKGLPIQILKKFNNRKTDHNVIIYCINY